MASVRPCLEGLRFRRFPRHAEFSSPQKLSSCSIFVVHFGAKLRCVLPSREVGGDCCGVTIGVGLQTSGSTSMHARRNTIVCYVLHRVGHLERFQKVRGRPRQSFSEDMIRQAKTDISQDMRSGWADHEGQFSLRENTHAQKDDFTKV